MAARKSTLRAASRVVTQPWTGFRALPRTLKGSSLLKSIVSPSTCLGIVDVIGCPLPFGSGLSAMCTFSHLGLDTVLGPAFRLGPYDCVKLLVD